MDKGTIENWKLLEEVKPLMDDELEFPEEIKITDGQPYKKMEFRPPTPTNNNEREFDTLAWKLRDREYYSIGKHDLKERPDALRFLELKSILIIEDLSKLHEYNRYLELIANPTGNSAEINDLVTLFRNRLKSNPRVGEVYFSQLPYALENPVFPTEINNKSDLKKNEKILKKGGYWDDEFNFIGRRENPIQIDYLYHWTLKKNLGEILKSGLLPGFLNHNAFGFKDFVWTALQDDSEWHKVLGTEEVFIPENWTKLRIKYDPNNMTAYFPLKGANYEDRQYFDDPVFMVISDKVLPLSEAVTIEMNRDLKYIQLQTHRRKKEIDESKIIWELPGLDDYQRQQVASKKGVGLWQYSKIHGRWAPPEMFGLDQLGVKWRPNNLAVPSTYNEVRLNYVAPEFIEVVAT